MLSFGRELKSSLASAICKREFPGTSTQMHSTHLSKKKMLKFKVKENFYHRVSSHSFHSLVEYGAFSTQISLACRRPAVLNDVETTSAG